jgi:aspartate-semialdehyde dehydrogenase
MSDAPLRIAIVGAGSLRGKDLKETLEQGSFASADIRLFDEDIAVGTLTRAGDEPAVIAAVDESSFEDVGLVFFAGRAEMAERHAAQALAAGARVIDLSEDPGLEGAVAWIPALDQTAGRPPGVVEGPVRSPSAAAILTASLAAGLGRLRPTRLVCVFLRPVSERGQEGIDELERQTVNLLSFRSFSDDVYGAQVAFNLMDAYGPANEPSLDSVRRCIERDALAALSGRGPGLAIQVLQAPVFYAYAFTAYFELEAPVEIPEIEAALEAAGLLVAPQAGPRPTNMTVAGQPQASLASPVRAPGHAAGYLVWGAADNVRLVAANAVKIAEALD